MRVVQQIHVAALAVLLICASPVSGQRQPGLAAFKPQRVLVMPSPGAELANLHAQLGVRVHRTYPDIGNLQVVQLPPTLTVPNAIAAYARSGLVEYAEADFIVEPQLTPNDFRYWDGSLWGLNNTGQLGGVADADIDAPEAWDLQSSAENVIVAVIDSGARFTHEDLAANMWVNPGESGTDFLGLDKRTNGRDDDGNGYIDDVHGIDAMIGTGVPLDDNGHGTHVAGTVGGVGNNSVGVVGVAWRARLMALKFFNVVGQGAISDAIECIDYARRKGAKVINASWGGYDFTSSALRDAIASTRTAGMIFVAACGNDHSNNDARPLYPASYDLDNIIAVAATTRRDKQATFSNYGATSVDLGAPGDVIFSCWNGSDSDYRYSQGTSMAAPHVAGACALVWARFPGEDYRQIIGRILSSVDPLADLAGKTVTGGRLNLYRALAGTAPPPAPSANPMYPDLITWTDWLRDIDMVDSNGRKLLRFSASYANTGRGPMEVYGVVQGDGTTYAYQRVWNDDGTYTDYLAGTFSFAGHQDHNHWHFDDFASYYLRRVTSSGGVGSIVAGSPKITFCLLDWTPYDRSLPGAPQNAVYTCDNQGISVGWADVYVKELEGQNIDITSVPDGVYWLESVTDPDNRLKEASDSNNSGRIKIQFSKSNNTVTFVDDTGGGTVVWVEDALPAGAVAYADGGDSWNWVASNPAPFSGSRAHQSNIGLGLHQHYFDWANATLNVAAGDKLFTYIFIDPLNVPEEVMLQWNDGSWEHRAYWGANRISYGTDGTASRRHMGALPPAGQWVRLEVPAVAVGLEGRTLKGMAFTLFGGRATWDYSGKEGN